MEISNLLNNEDGSSNRPSSNNNAPQLQPKKRPRPVVGTRTPSLLSQEILISPSPEPPRSAPTDVSKPQLHPSHYHPSAASTPSTTATFADGFGQPSPPLQRPSLLDHRPTSASSLEVPLESPSLRPQIQSPQSVAQRPDLNATRSPSLSYARHVTAPLARTHSASDLVMAEAPAQTPPPRNFTASSISDADLKTINELTSYLADNSYDYNSHVQLINLLHRGFVAHVDAPTLPQPSDYSLLKELRMARGAMDSRYSVGEDIWRDWINDESMLAKSSEDRTAVMELCMKATQEEPTSIVLWSLYGEWVWSTYAVANGFSEGDEDTWTEDDKMICKEVFTRDMVLDVWTQAVEATQWRMDESHVVWNRYVELIMQDFPGHPSVQAVEKVQMLYMTRLQVPHAAWDATSQAFWPFISKYKSEGWEEIMSAANELAAFAKKVTNMRAEHEVQVTLAYRQDDKVALYNAYVAYLNWEAKREEKKRKNKKSKTTEAENQIEDELRSALFERALLRFPTMVEWWLDYVDSLDITSKHILPLLERATRHCPWSGELWSRRLLRVEFETQSYEAVEGVKHKATNSGLLPTGGMEEIILVNAAWCSYLRRRAFAPIASDDDVDMADIAISAALEDAKGDPLWRIEKILIKFYTQARRITEARRFWRELIPERRNNYDFWAKYYDWEILVWGMERNVFQPDSNGVESTPQLASAVLQEAMKEKDLDWPEKIHELYSHHFHTHETVAEIQTAQRELRRTQKDVRVRREREAAAAAEAGAEAQAQAQPQAEAVSQMEPAAEAGDTIPAKRKREDETANENGVAIKRNKVDDTKAAEDEHIESPPSASAQVKRDREHNTVTVTHLPSTIAEKTLRRFFADCGKILSINILVDEKSSSASATIEFETHEDVLAAKVREGKKIEGNEIHIQAGTLSTLYVTNYPPSYGEDDIQQIFQDYGSIVSIRLPSLKFNQRRRFCYVQFVTAEEARNATKLHDTVIDGQHRLVVLVSDPHAKKDRQGAISEGREVYIGNVDFSATEEDIREFFEQAGKIEHVRMIKNATGRFTGTVFVIYHTADEAQQSLSLNQKSFKNRLLRVSIATDKSTRDAANKKHGTTKVFDTATAGSPPSVDSPADTSSPRADGGSHAEGADTARTKRERTIALLNLPETVNDARITSLFSSFGAIRKLTVRRDKAGALVEFVNVDDAGRASLSADAVSLGGECRLGTAAELLGSAAKKGKPSTDGKEKTGQDKPIKPALVSRPGQGARGGRKPGLGVKRATASATNADESGETEEKSKRSNADFRAMFLAGNGVGKEESETGKDA
ncbi:hypothetical protein K461DRAFT_311337 [Myriangium duriaei CBS 260.36]|uniref:U4/U6 snRNA-associated-splicing factor PRP24 n=1 Tax=Myriangium duriaei CBS 260.36 TaxID=1168546 RepID=A0A9P4MMA6_9PEZI|nr:hypothetical protein K461DRAFT_311337 [Myriangium duriaei CBS 260.36]